MTAQPEEHPDPSPQPDPAPGNDAEHPDVEPAADAAADPGEDRPAEPVQPAQVEPAPMGKVLEFRTPRGSLTLRPNQTALEPEQRAALLAIGIDTDANNGAVIPHLRAFVHMCQIRDLDPFAREAYLIARGKGEKTTYTMQTGIDGYRKMGTATGRFIRVKSRLWTGAEDDDRSWVPFNDGDGGVIMKRVWWDQWPATRGYPGAAKCVIEHYDDAGNVVTSEGIADWGMYAPFTDKWDWGAKRGERVYETDANGDRIKVLNEMWSKGYAHMLVKCAEALAYRTAFPARMSGIYTHEEMHRLDQQERDRMEHEQRAMRREAYAAATGRPAPPPGFTADRPRDPEPPPADVEPEPAGPMPMPVGDVLPDVARSAASTAPSDTDDDVSPEQQTEWLRAELAYQADVIGQPEARLAQRAVRALRKNVEDMNPAELAPVVLGLRAAVISRLREADRHREATTYAAVGQDVADVMAAVGGVTRATDDVVDAEVVDPDTEHRYAAAPGGGCDVCGLPEDVGPHPA